jgi:hypothetical protein
LINLLRIGSVLMLLGRSWEHIRWGGHLRDLFYNPEGFGGWFSGLIGIPLNEIYADHFYEGVVQHIADGMGIVFLLAAVVILFYEKLNRFKVLIYIALGLLLLTLLGIMMERHFDEWGILFEHSSQWMIPLLFLWSFNKRNDKVFIWGAISIGLTFLCHGLYAVGYYAQPGFFVDMMIVGIGFTEDIARAQLVTLGYLDFIFAIGMGIMLMRSLPYYNSLVMRVFINGCLIYGMLWGFITAFARVYVTYLEGQVAHWMDQYWLEFITRAPHFVVPLVLFNMYRNRTSRLI